MHYQTILFPARSLCYCYCVAIIVFSSGYGDHGVVDWNFADDVVVSVRSNVFAVVAIFLK